MSWDNELFSDLDREIYHREEEDSDRGPSGPSDSPLYSRATGVADRERLGDVLILPAPSQPMLVAREIVSRIYTQPAGLILRNHRGDFYHWDGTRWPELETRDLRARSYGLLEHAVYEHVDSKGVRSLKPFAPTQRKISDILDALGAIVLVRSGADAPCWIDDRLHPPAHEVIAMTNGLLHVPTRTLVAHSAMFFTHHSLPFSFGLAR